MNKFCTLFDSHYLSRGLVMYRSLATTGADFHLYVYAFDDLCCDILLRMELPFMTVVTLTEFEDERLLAIKPTRSRGEYCWTCASHIIAHALKSFCLPEITYIDADLYFYQDPVIILNEFKDSGASVLITSHRYTPRYDLSAQKGIYNVQFITFCSDPRGKSVLSWWQERCLEWCYDRNEDGLFGDQKYLDGWPERFSGIHVLEHLGGGVAPWNVQQYNVRHDGLRILVNNTQLIFYHFHDYKYYQDGSKNLGNYPLNATVVDLLYRPYASSMQEAQAEISKFYQGSDLGCSTWESSIRIILGRFLRMLKGEYNVYRNL